MLKDLFVRLFLGNLRSKLEDVSSPLHSLYVATRGWKTGTGALLALAAFIAWLLGYDPTIAMSVSSVLVGLGLVDKGGSMDCPLWVKDLWLYRFLSSFSFEISALIGWAGMQLSGTCTSADACYAASVAGSCWITCKVASWGYFLSAAMFAWLGLFDSALLARPLSLPPKKK